MRGSHVNAAEHYRQQYRDAETRTALLVGLLAGLTLGLVWEAIRR